MENEQQKAKGYLIANFTIHDQETFKKYVEVGSSLAAKFNGKIIAFDTTPTPQNPCIYNDYLANHTNNFNISQTR